MSEEVQTKVGFADSELEEYQRSAAELTVRVRCWNETLAVVTFREVLAVRDLMAGNFSNFVFDEGKSMAFFSQVIAAAQGEGSPVEGYKVFSFLNDDDQPSLDVVAKSCEVQSSDS